MLALVLTNVEALNGANLTAAPAVVDRMTVKVAAVLVGVAAKTIRNDLSEFKDLFDTPSYKLAPGSRWRQRLITARDLATLRQKYKEVSSYK